MIIDTTNQRQSKFIVGILIITVFTICFAIVFGYWSYLRVNQNENYLLNSSFSPNLIEDSSGNKKIVTVAQGMEMFDLDTEKGKIEGFEEFLPDWDVVPLCITDVLLEDYWLTVKVTGGYKPYCLLDGWYIDLYQDTDDVKTTKEFIGRINLVVSTDTVECCYTIYKITFDVVDDCIHVDSNHFPDFPAGWVLTEKVADTETLNKLVDLKIVTHWYGCGLPDQRFELILSQKIKFPESTNSRM